jgi:hypothetical protein
VFSSKSSSIFPIYSLPNAYGKFLIKVLCLCVFVCGGSFVSLFKINDGLKLLFYYVDIPVRISSKSWV